MDYYELYYMVAVNTLLLLVETTKGSLSRSSWINSCKPRKDIICEECPDNVRGKQDPTFWFLGPCLGQRIDPRFVEFLCTGGSRELVRLD